MFYGPSMISVALRNTLLCPSSTLLQKVPETLAVDVHYEVIPRLIFHVMSWTQAGSELQKPP